MNQPTSRWGARAKFSSDITKLNYRWFGGDKSILRLLSPVGPCGPLGDTGGVIRPVEGTYATGWERPPSTLGISILWVSKKVFDIPGKGLT